MGYFFGLRTQKLEASKTIEPATSAVSGASSAKAEALEAKLAAVKGGGGGGGRVRWGLNTMALEVHTNRVSKNRKFDIDFNVSLYRVSQEVVDWVVLTWIFSVPLSADGNLGEAARQLGKMVEHRH